MQGKLFVIEGVDGSGKATQTARLYDALVRAGHSAGRVEFPNYASPSSSLIKMYLNGDFGVQADDVNPSSPPPFMLWIALPLSARNGKRFTSQAASSWLTATPRPI